MIEIVRIKDFANQLLEYIPNDIKNHEQDEENTFLYRMFYGCKDGNFDFYKQAKSLFLRDQTNPRKIEVRMEFPKDKTSLPCYVIREPGKDKGPANTIGKMTGVMYPGESWEIRDNRHFTFEIMCLSDNFLESIIMSETLYALFLAGYNVLANTYTSIELSNSEVIPQLDLMPLPIFIRSLRLDLSVDFYIGSLVDKQLLAHTLKWQDAGEAAVELTHNIVWNQIPGADSEITK